MSWDDDIAKLDLSDGEKNGLQVFRNYERSFSAEAGRRFVATVDARDEKFDRTDRIVSILATENAHLLPMILCAYADEILDEMFKSSIPEGVPGGRATLFSGFGPIGSLSNRIKIAYAFDMIAPNILAELDQLRTVRNKIAHDWDHGKHAELFTRSPLSDLHPVERGIEWEDVTKDQIENLDPLSRFRIRLIWLTALLTYEATYRPSAKRARLEPNTVLYGTHRPKALSTLAAFAARETRKIFSAKSLAGT